MSLSRELHYTEKGERGGKDPHSRSLNGVLTFSRFPRIIYDSAVESRGAAEEWSAPPLLSPYILFPHSWKMKLTMSSYASLMAVSASTPMSGTAVVTGVSEEIWGMSCKEKGEVGLVVCAKNFLKRRTCTADNIIKELWKCWVWDGGKHWGEGEGVAPPPGK